MKSLNKLETEVDNLESELETLKKEKALREKRYELRKNIDELKNKNKISNIILRGIIGFFKSIISGFKRIVDRFI